MDVVVPYEMEDAVNEEPTKLSLEAVLIVMCLARCGLGTDHDVAEVTTKGSWIYGPLFERKG